MVVDGCRWFKVVPSFSNYGCGVCCSQFLSLSHLPRKACKLLNVCSILIKVLI